jgi:hypothetical protein
MNNYFEYPILWDYLGLSIINIILCVLVSQGLLLIPSDSYNLSVASDIANIGFTSAGFVLTFLTLLITFKSSSTTTKESNVETNTLFDLFLATDLYEKTINHLKNAVKSLIFMAMIGYVFKLLLNPSYQYLTYYFNVSGVFLTSITLWRCLIILTKILKMQKE